MPRIGLVTSATVQSSGRPVPPLTPLLLVLALLGPMHLGLTWNTNHDTLPSRIPRLHRHQLKRKVHDTSRDVTSLFRDRTYQISDLGDVSIDEIARYERLSSKSSYDPVKFPMFTTISKKKVLFLSQNLVSGKVQHVLLDGFQRSDFIDLVYVVALNSSSSYTTEWGEDLWVHDSPSPECSSPELLNYLVSAQQLGNHNRNILLLQVDYEDFPMVQTCSKLIPLIGGKENIRYAKRSIVEGRQFNWTKGWVDHGYYSNNSGLDVTGGPIVHAPYGVRTDQVEILRELILDQNVTSPVDFGPKSWDVSHLWDKDNHPVSHLRNRVTDVCLELVGITLPSSGRKLRAWCQLAGTRGSRGRRTVHREYLMQLLSSRIVIVTQRDKWEGHYRLMEALAAGTMVLADFMLSLPKGLVHGESVVLFRSEQELRDLILYYADHEEERRQIALRGWEVAMGRHRSWHRMEELLLVDR